MTEECLKNEKYRHLCAQVILLIAPLESSSYEIEASLSRMRGRAHKHWKDEAKSRVET